MHCTIRHYPSQALASLINRSPPRCFSYKNCFITSAVSRIKGKKSKALSKAVVGCMKTSPTSSGKLWKQHWGQSQYPMLLVLIIFSGALLYCLVCSSYWVSTEGRTLTHYKSGNLSFCSVAENSVTGYPFFLEGRVRCVMPKMNHALTQAFSKRLRLTKKRTLIYWCQDCNHDYPKRKQSKFVSERFCYPPWSSLRRKPWVAMYEKCYFLKYQFKIAIVFSFKTHYISNRK